MIIHFSFRYELMKLCWKFRQRHRPTFCKIVEMLVPDLDPSFRDFAFFFSDDNMCDTHDSGGEEDHGGGGDELRTPLTGSHSRESLSLSDIDGGVSYRSNASLNDSGTHLHLSQGDHDDCHCVDIDDKIKMRNVPASGASRHTPPHGSPTHHPLDQHMRDSSFIGPPPIISSNEGSKESSKSSGSSSLFHLNGVANGHIPRANNMQGCSEC